MNMDLGNSQRNIFWDLPLFSFVISGCSQCSDQIYFGCVFVSRLWCAIRKGDQKNYDFVLNIGWVGVLKSKTFTMFFFCKFLGAL